MKTSFVWAMALFFQSFICNAEEFKGPIRFSVEESVNGRVESKLFDELPFEAWNQAETLKNLVNDLVSVGVINGQVGVDGYDANMGIPLSNLSIAGFSLLHECLKEGVGHGVTSREQGLENQKSCVERLSNKELAQFVLNANYLDAEDLLSFSKEALKQRIQPEIQGSLDAYQEWLLATEVAPGVRFDPQFVLGRKEFMQFFFDIQWAMKRLKSNKSKLVGELFSAKAFSNFRHWHGTRKSASILAQEHVQSFGTRRLLAFSHDGSKLAVMRNIADRGRIIQVFDVQTSKTIVYSDGDQNRYYSFAWSPDDQYLAYAGDGRSIKFLDLRPSGHSGGGRCLLGGQWIDGSLAKEAPSLTHVIGVKNSSGPILSLGFSQKDDRVGYSVVKDGTVKCGIFHLGSTKSKQDVIFDTGYPVKNGNSEFGAPSIVMHSIEFGDNDTVTCSSDQFISVFDLRSRERISFTEKTSQSDSRKVFENASFFQKENDYSSTLDGQIGISLQPKKNKYKVSQFALSPDGHFLAQFTLDEELSKPFMGGISKYTSSSHERVKIWNVDLDKNLKSEINQLPNEQAYLLLLMLKQDLKAKDLKKFPLLHELYKSMKSVAKQIL